MVKRSDGKKPPSSGAGIRREPTTINGPFIDDAGEKLGDDGLMEDVVGETHKVTNARTLTDEKILRFRMWVDFLRRGGNPDHESFLALPYRYRIEVIKSARADGWNLKYEEIVKKIIFDRGLNPIIEAHNCVAAVLKERSAALPKAFISNVRRDAPGAFDGVLGILVGAGVFVLTGDPTLVLASAPFGFFARNAQRLFRIRGSRDKLGDSNIPELASFWNLTCYKFVRLQRGFNARVDVITALREDDVELEVACEWERRLEEARLKLIRARDECIRLQSLTYNREDHDELEDRVRMVDPLGYGTGNVPELDWLDLDAEMIRNSMAVDQFQRDVVAMSDLRERHERMQESHREVEVGLKGDDSVYKDMERKHGEEVDIILDSEDKDD